MFNHLNDSYKLRLKKMAEQILDLMNNRLLISAKDRNTIWHEPKHLNQCKSANTRWWILKTSSCVYFQIFQIRLNCCGGWQAFHMEYSYDWSQEWLCFGEENLKNAWKDRCNMNKEKIDNDVKKLVLWRIDTSPSNFKLSIGSKGTFNKEELKEHVEKEDDIGQAVIKMQMQFIKDLSSGKISKALAEWKRLF